MNEGKKQIPTKKWIQDQVNYHRQAILLNQGSLNLLEAMLQNEIYIEEEKKDVTNL